ncbi:hypothetical protein Q8A73_000142 [Channa argus]|nr:hypothetical protein Q8A73_000142 [Channa argus]
MADSVNHCSITHWMIKSSRPLILRAHTRLSPPRLKVTESAEKARAPFLPLPHVFSYNKSIYQKYMSLMKRRQPPDEQSRLPNTLLSSRSRFALRHMHFERRLVKFCQIFAVEDKEPYSGAVAKTCKSCTFEQKVQVPQGGTGGSIARSPRRIKSLQVCSQFLHG